MIVPEPVGKDELGRDVGLVFAEDFRALTEVTLPPGTFIFFLGADTTTAIPEPLYEITRRLLEAGAVYVMCWGPSCERAEDLVDEAVVGDAGDDAFGEVMTTSHPNESILEALTFATSIAIPADSFAPSCTHVLVAFVGNVNWYNEGQNCLEDLLLS